MMRRCKLLVRALRLLKKSLIFVTKRVQRIDKQRIEIKKIDDFFSIHFNRFHSCTIIKDSFSIDKRKTAQDDQSSFSFSVMKSHEAMNTNIFIVPFQRCILALLPKMESDYFTVNCVHFLRSIRRRLPVCENVRNERKNH